MTGYIFYTSRKKKKPQPPLKFKIVISVFQKVWVHQSDTNKHKGVGCQNTFPLVFSTNIFYFFFCSGNTHFVV